jgi:hypothetical protein
MRPILGFWTWTNDASGVPLVDYFSLTLDMNTAMRLYLSDYYGVTYTDLQHPLARYLREASAQDIQNQWKKLRRRARGDAS